jgi:hypothetical protein
MTENSDDYFYSNETTNPNSSILNVAQSTASNHNITHGAIPASDDNHRFIIQKGL